jgi:hypothetical protein
MNAKTRFLTGSLASLAIASAVTLSAPPASAADGPGQVPGLPCGQPAVPAVYVTVTHDPELRLVPAVTHDEWRWERAVTTYEYEFATVVAPAHSESDWTREVPGTTEYEWSRTVVDRAAVPAVPGTAEVGHWETRVVTPAVTVTVFEYVQQQTGRTRWERDGWNGEKDDEDKGRGWTRTGHTREDVTTPAVTAPYWVVDQPSTDGTPAVDALTHSETTWATSSPGGDWTGPSAARTVGGGTETATTTGDDVPAGDGWTRIDSRTVPAVVDLGWAQQVPEGALATGASRVHDVTTEQTDNTSATAPDGAGWSPVAGSRVVVVDQAETTELVGTGGTEEVLVSPAQAAGEPCPEVAQGSSSAADGPKAGGSSVVSAAQAAGATTVTAAGAETTTVLPATGSPVSPLLLATGLGALLAGGVLVRAGRGRHTS